MFVNFWGNINSCMIGVNPYMVGAVNPFMAYYANPYMMRFNFIQSMIGNMLRGFSNQGCNCQNYTVQQFPQIANYTAVQSPYNDISVFLQPIGSRANYTNNNALAQFNNAYSECMDYIANYGKTQNSSAYNFGTATLSLRSNTNTNVNLNPQGKFNNVNTNINTAYTGSASDLNKRLKGVLSGKGDVFIKAQKEYGVNAAFLASVCVHESGNGSSNMAKNKNNVGGVRYPGKTEFRTFNSVDECIMYMASFLKRSYIDKGLITIGQVGAKYCPANDPTDTKGTNNLWASRVSSLYKDYSS